MSRSLPPRRGAARALLAVCALWTCLANAGDDPEDEPPAASENAAPADEAILDPAWSEDDAMRLANLREDVRAWVTLQRVLAWYSAAEGERPYTAEMYRGHQTLFSRASLEFLERARSRKGLQPEELRALEYLKTFIAIEYINLRAAPFDDRLAHAGSSARIRLSWRVEPVSYRELETLAGTEQTTERRREIEAAFERLWAETLNPIIAEKEALVRTLAVDAGFPSYVALVQQYRQVDLKKLITDATAFLNDTDARYRALLAEQSRLILKKPLEKVSRADLRFLHHPPDFNRFFPKALQLEAMRDLLRSLDLSLVSAGGREITLDTSPAVDGLEPACVAVDVPQDVRISIPPATGITGFSRTFHEVGHALHLAGTMTPVFEFQYLGSETSAEAYAELFRAMWGDPRWLKRYRRLVQGYNLRMPRQRIPVMTDRDIARAVRYHVFSEIYHLRRVAFAKVAYETALHGGSRELYQAALPEPVTDFQEAYRLLFSRAYGIALSAEDALRFRTDVEPFMFSADDARALVLSHQLHEALRTRFGDDWFENRRARDFLLELWKDGNRWTASELASRLGQAGPDFGVVKQRLERLLAEAARLEKSPN